MYAICCMIYAAISLKAYVAFRTHFHNYAQDKCTAFWCWCYLQLDFCQAGCESVSISICDVRSAFDQYAPVDVIWESENLPFMLNFFAVSG